MKKIVGAAAFLVLVFISIQIYKSGAWLPYFNRFTGVESFGVPVAIPARTRVLMEDNMTGVYLTATDVSDKGADMVITFRCVGACVVAPGEKDMRLLGNQKKIEYNRSFELISVTDNSATLIVNKVAPAAK